MKFKIKEDKPKEDVLRFYLETNRSGGLGLCCKDSEGSEWYILQISNETGKIYLAGHIPDDIGLCVDDNGRIIIEER